MVCWQATAAAAARLEAAEARNARLMASLRAAAVAERLWSPRDVNDLRAAWGRLAHHACRLGRRGVRGTPLGPGTCAEASSGTVLMI